MSFKTNNTKNCFFFSLKFQQFFLSFKENLNYTFNGYKWTNKKQT